MPSKDIKLSPKEAQKLADNVADVLNDTSIKDATLEIKDNSSNDPLVLELKSKDGDDTPERKNLSKAATKRITAGIAAAMNDADVEDATLKFRNKSINISADQKQDVDLSGKDYTEFGKRLYAVPEDRPFYHGTQSFTFDTPKTGTHITSNLHIARSFAEGGPFFKGDGEEDDGEDSKDENARIIEFRASVPGGRVPRISLSETFTEDYDDLPPKGTAAGQKELETIAAEYYKQADDEARKKGFPAYYTGFYNYKGIGGEKKLSLLNDLRVLDPDVVRVARQNAKTPGKAKIKFNDLSQPGSGKKPKRKASKKGRGGMEHKANR